MLRDTILIKQVDQQLLSLGHPYLRVNLSSFSITCFIKLTYFITILSMVHLKPI